MGDNQKKEKKATQNKLSASFLRKGLKIFWSTLAGGLALFVLLFFLISQGMLGVMPTFEELENPFISQASIIFSEDGTELGSYFIENRNDVDFLLLSPNVVKALLATEDGRY